MTIADALLEIERSWPDVEPRLTVAELYQLAATLHRPGPDLLGDNQDVAMVVIGIVTAALPSGQDLWDALDALPDGYTDEPADVGDLLRRLRALADEALTQPATWIDAEADTGSALSIAAILEEGVVDDGRIRELEGPLALLGLPVEEGIVYPAFQFQLEPSLRPYPLVAHVNERVEAERDPWGTAAWWLTGNRWLSARPADLLGTDRESEIMYAAEQLDNDNW
jgi:hypothetical protein